MQLQVRPRRAPAEPCPRSQARRAGLAAVDDRAHAPTDLPSCVRTAATPGRSAARAARSGIDCGDNRAGTSATAIGNPSALRASGPGSSTAPATRFRCHPGGGLDGRCLCARPAPRGRRPAERHAPPGRRRTGISLNSRDGVHAGWAAGSLAPTCPGAPAQSRSGRHARARQLPAPAAASPAPLLPSRRQRQGQSPRRPSPDPDTDGAD